MIFVTEKANFVAETANGLLGNCLWAVIKPFETNPMIVVDLKQ